MHLELSNQFAEIPQLFAHRSFTSLPSDRENVMRVVHILLVVELPHVLQQRIFLHGNQNISMLTLIFVGCVGLILCIVQTLDHVLIVKVLRHHFIAKRALHIFGVLEHVLVLLIFIGLGHWRRLILDGFIFFDYTFEVTLYLFCEFESLGFNLLDVF